MFIGYTVGSAVGGIIAAQLIPTWGWPSVFVVGGVLPIAIALVSLFVLPESVRFLMVKRGRTDLVLGLLRRIRPDLVVPDNASLAIEEENKEGLPVAHLFVADGRASMTALLWLAYAANMVSLHFLTSWLPTVVAESGVPLAHAVIATALLQGGGAVGSVVVGRLLDRIGTLGIVAAFLVAVPCVAALGHIGTSETPLMALVIVAGFCIIGGQVGINALAGTLYPTYMRSTGTGWAFGVGRAGSILGPVIGGQLLALGLPLGMLFAAASAPVLISASALFFLGRLPILRNRVAGMAAQSPALSSPLYPASEGHRP
jgi:AAHS family 4-hydroxybenzoate transporter-like MFS transporter